MRGFYSVARSNFPEPSAHSTGKNAHATQEPHHAAAADTAPSVESQPADGEFPHQARANPHPAVESSRPAAADTRATGAEAHPDADAARADAADAHPAGESGRAAGEF